MGWRIASVALVVIVACRGDLGAGRGDPYTDAPAEPSPRARIEWWTASVLGTIVGREQRVFGPGQSASRRAEFAFRKGRSTERIYRASRVDCDGSGCTVQRMGDRSIDEERYEGAVLPELWPPPLPYKGAVLDAGGLAPEAELSIEGDRLSWVGRAGPTQVWLDERGLPWRARFGVVDWQRVDSPPAAPEPTDIARLLAIEVPRVKNARKTVVGEYLVAGKPVRVEVPTWMELPPQASEVRALVLEVADRVQDAFVPGEASAGSLQRGDCTEHALALVEAASARGWRARTAAGRVYVDGDEGGLLVLHAWAEIELGGKFIGADAALRQFPADATHLKLGEWIGDLPALDADGLAPIEIRSLK